MKLDVTLAKVHGADYRHSDPADSRDAAALALATMASLAVTMGDPANHPQLPDDARKGLSATLAGLLTSVQILADALYGEAVGKAMVAQLEEVIRDGLSDS